MYSVQALFDVCFPFLSWFETNHYIIISHADTRLGAFCELTFLPQRENLIDPEMFALVLVDRMCHRQADGLVLTVNSLLLYTPQNIWLYWYAKSVVTL